MTPSIDISALHRHRPLQPLQPLLVTDGPQARYSFVSYGIVVALVLLAAVVILIVKGLQVIADDESSSHLPHHLAGISHHLPIIFQHLPIISPSSPHHLADGPIISPSRRQANSDADLDNVEDDIERDGLIEGLLKLAWTSAVSLTTLLFNFIIKRVVTKVRACVTYGLQGLYVVCIRHASWHTSCSTIRMGATTHAVCCSRAAPILILLYPVPSPSLPPISR